LEREGASVVKYKETGSQRADEFLDDVQELRSSVLHTH
jgi:hypothetical protein